MDPAQRLRRITELFEEGAVVSLGDDVDGPILVWVNKLNSFQTEEARRDGVARRGMRLAELGKPETPERKAIDAEIEGMDLDQLRHAWVNQQAEEQYLAALDDIDSEPEWRDKLDMIRRLPVLLEESAAAPDDPRRMELLDLQRAYFGAVQDAQETKQKQALTEAEGRDRDDLIHDFLERWRQRVSLDEFMEERRVTELFYAIRVCQAARDGNGYDHTACDHRERALETRDQVRGLPEQVLVQVIGALDQLNISPREAGNSVAPESSSASSEQPNVPEDSTPSTPVVTSSGSPTTSVSPSLSP